MKNLLKKLIPPRFFDLYHRLLAYSSAVRYGFPSRRMIVIGVTGTNGKSTTSAMIARILEEAGYRVGLATTAQFQIAEKKWLNNTKMTMLGRSRLQKLLADMVTAKCAYAVIETSSEGIKQHRHAGIHYDVAVFTNLTPEHLESHGGFENYKAAKLALFKKLEKDPPKHIDQKSIPKVIVANIDSAHGSDFLNFKVNKKYGFTLDGGDGSKIKWPLGIVKAMDVQLNENGSSFVVRDTRFSLSMPGRFNVENALAAIAVALGQNIPLSIASEALRKMTGVPGRMERIDEGQPFTVLVDYAPEVESLRQLYKAVELIPKKRIIHLLGSCGGGRDRDRQPVLGRMAGESADIVIVTNEDPYDDDPREIINNVARGAREKGKRDNENLFLIEDRREAIKKAVELAKEGDLVLLTGKGAEQAICVANGKKIAWDERDVARQAIRTMI